MESIIILALIMFFFYLDEQGKKDRSEEAKKSRQARYSARQTGRKTSASTTGFRYSSDKAAAFEEFISWAKQEAKSQGISFDGLAGENDYQRARKVFQDSKKWKQLRQSTLARYSSCLRCGTNSNLQADHVVPMALRPDMFNHESNLQTLCGPCNRWKGVEIIDFRSESREPAALPQRKSPVRPKRTPSPISKHDDGPTEKQKEIWATLSLSPEELRQHNKRVTQEVLAERMAAQEARRAQKRDGLKPKHKVVSVKERKSRERVIRVSKNLEAWRCANEWIVINEVKLRSPMRKHGRFDWYLCERAFREAEYQQGQSGQVRFSYLG